MAENWRKWWQSFELYCIASGLSEKTEKVKSATFLHVAGEEAIKVFNTFIFEAGEDKEKLNKLKEKFEQYCEPRKNLTYLRHLFFTRSQNSGETIDSYVTDLKNKAKHCEFGDLETSLVKDRIVCGIQSDAVRARLLRETDLGLSKAIDICRANECTMAQMKMLHEERPVAAVGASARPTAKTNYKKKSYKEEQGKFHWKQNRSGSCPKCGTSHDPKKCPAYGNFFLFL